MSSLSETLGNELPEEGEDRGINAYSTPSAYVMDSSSSQIVLSDDVPPPPPTAETQDQGIPTEASLNPGDSYYQWHLTGEWGIRADEVWNDYTGAGVLVAVMDDGFQYTHADLSANYNTSIDFDTTGANDDDAGAASSNNHGTAVSGIIAADDNGSGMVGVAFDAEITGIRLDFSGGVTPILEGLQHTLAINADVMNNSWGYPQTFADNPNINYGGGTFADVNNALIDLVSQGRGGLGTSVVFSAGNHSGSDQNVNNHSLQNSTFTIAVGGTDENGNRYDSSTPGAAILTSSGAELVNTIDKEGAYGYNGGDQVTVSGTSFSAPTVSGVIALMYEANADLGYRDVQEILAMSSRKANETTFQTNGANNWNGGGMHFSHDYGFGLIDAHDAVRLAETWTEQKTYANMETVVQNVSSTGAIADNGTTNFTFVVSENISVEQIQLDIDISHSKAGDLKITLISPDGTESYLVDTLDFGQFISDPSGYVGIKAPLTSVAHWGEESAGTWTLRVQDVVGGNTGSLQSATLKLLGSEITADNTYVFTDEYISGATITDSNGGVDTLNLSPVRSDITLNMTNGSNSSIGGKTVNIANGSNIENAYLGDGNDTVTGNTLNNDIMTGRGNDLINGSAGNDTIDGAQGNDSVSYNVNISNFLVEIIDATTVRLTDVISNFGQDLLENIENFLFSDGSYTFVELENYVANNGTPPHMLFKFQWDGNNAFHNSSSSGDYNLTAVDLNITDASGDLVNVDRSYLSASLSVLDPAAQNVEGININFAGAYTLSLDGFKNNTITLGGSSTSTLTVTNAMATNLTTGGGADIINITLSEIIVPSGTRDQVRVTSGAGNDAITIGGVHSNFYANIFAGDGDDQIDVITLNNGYIYGEGGNDTINASWGAERIEGGLGDDVIFANRGNDTVYGGDGADEIHGGLNDDYLAGDNGDDLIYGDEGNDRILGGSGNDTLYGGLGNDTIYGHADNDTIYGDGGRDIINAGDGDDVVNGGDWHDLIYGGNGDDVLNGDAGNDELRGDAGNDTLNGNDGYDKLLGGDGNDVLSGGDGNDKIYGQNDNDTLYGGANSDNLYGGYGDDVLFGGEGVDYLFGNQGADTFHLDLTSQDRIKDFKQSDGDMIDIADLLSGFGVGSDINDFVKITIQDQYRTDIQINHDGTGNDFQYAGIIYGNLTGETVDSLVSSGTLIV